MLHARQRILQDALQRLARRGARNSVEKILAKSHPADIAAVFPSLVPKDQRAVFDMLEDDEKRGETLGYLEDAVCEDFVPTLEMDQVVRVFKIMSNDDVADIMGRLPETYAQEILQRMEDQDSEAVEGLLQYREDSAGGIMSPDFFALDEETTAEDAIRALRREAEQVEMAFYIYVVNVHGHLVGVCSLRQLVTAQASTTLTEIMITDVISVVPECDQEEVARIVSRYGFLAVPVVDDANKLVGIVTVDDVIDVIREEATEDFLKMAGAGEELVETKSLGKSIRARAPWLLASCLGGLVAAIIMTPFQDSLRGDVYLAMFMPVILGMGGNIGTQSSTIMVRGLATGVIELAHMRKVLAKEMGVAVVLGLAYGVLAGLAAGGLSMRVMFGLVIAISLLCSMLIATLVGTSLPLLLARLHIDPAVATGPFVTTSVDVLGILAYFGIASALLTTVVSAA